MVDKSLSRGLADRVLDEMSGLAHAYITRCRGVLSAIPEKRHAVKAAAHAMRTAGEACSLTQVIAAHPKWRWASTCAFVPELRPGEGSNARVLAFRTLRTYCHVDRWSRVECEEASHLTIHEHAIERLFQRLNVLDAAAVREEIHDAVLLAPPLLAASRAACRLQAVLPTRWGAFLCCVSESGGLVAKTWIPATEEPCRHSEPLRIANDYLTEVGGEQGVGSEIGGLAMEVPLRALPPDASLVRRLGDIAWLGEAYSPRHDPIGDLWQRAREQQLAA